ncbi:hypothetical protein [Vallitalea maricola]|uniref:Uncharacterized protein n=1 Tax=Vallitalea maricola TaxID=3074433 RepID=A0ACB5ULG8_9FIRM|nr:hypothetical protein AN2V17_30580 [Vallitalea sp. AN17-2]
MTKIYYKITSQNHDQCILTNSQEVVLYSKIDEDYNCIGSFWLLSKTCFSFLGNISDTDDLEEKKWREKVNEFLKSNKILYHYYYSSKGDFDFWEVPFEAERNKYGVKPSSIEIWYPSKYIDQMVIKNTIYVFSKKFLELEEVEIINFLGVAIMD